MSRGWGGREQREDEAVGEREGGFGWIKNLVYGSHSDSWYRGWDIEDDGCGKTEYRG